MKTYKLIYVGLIILLSLVTFAYSENVVISEVLYYPIGAESKEWIELYNPTDNAIDIGGWKIYSFFNKSPDLTIPSGKIIQSHGYFLIGDLGWDESWPEADYKVRLWLTNVNAGVKLTDNNGIAIDALGWGTSSQILYGYYEGEAHSLVASGHSLERILMPDCSVQDTNNNSVDFIDNTQLSPRNSDYMCGESICGDNIIEGSEVCDGSNLNGKTCISLGYDYGNLICLSDCSGYDTSNCKDYVCGNNIQEPGEECDDGNLVNEDGCSSLCRIEHLPFCGDNVINNGEVCDGSDLNSKTCVDFGYSNPNTLTCNANCLSFNAAGCSAVCGNNVKETEEECDDGNLINKDGCSSDCKSEVTDDLKINYIRGKMSIEGIAAQEGTYYKIEIISGDNVGSYYEGVVGGDVPNFLKGNGLFDTRDRIIFTTGSAFRITPNDCERVYEGQFLNGGNGNFLDEGSIVNFNCMIRPVINKVYHSPVQPTELDNISIFTDVTDNIGVDKVFVNYNVNNAGIESKEMDLNVIYSASLGIFNKGDVIDYAITAKDVNGNEVWSDGFLITVKAGDKDKDGYNSDDDCNDNNALINPAATEICNSIDDDCNNIIDEEDAIGCTVYYKDRDNDAYGLTDDNKCLCSAQDPYDAKQSNDCNDNSSLINPAAIESCNGIDDDCDGTTDEEDATGCTIYNKDFDIDGYGSNDTKCLCLAYYPYNATRNNDCDDNNSLINPSITESCNGLDDDCDGVVDEEDALGCNVYYKDEDDDFYGSIPDSVEDTLSEGETKKYTLNKRDYNVTVTAITDTGTIYAKFNINGELTPLLKEGNSATLSDGATIIVRDIIPNEVGDVTQDLVTLQDLVTFELSISDNKCLCVAQDPYDAEQSNDCDDNNSLINPLATEICNGVDDDCDSIIDEEDATGCTPFNKDFDIDGYGSNDTKCLCLAYYPYNATRNNDCDDNNSLINPSATESCNGLDDNCDSTIDEGFTDTDGDGMADYCVDVDDDNDGINDTEDAYPLDRHRSILGDVNGDDKVDITDLMTVRREFGKTPSDPNWDPYYDVNGDGDINILDLIIIKRHFT